MADLGEVVVEAPQVGCLHPQVCLSRHGVGELGHRLLQAEAAQGAHPGCRGRQRLEQLQDREWCMSGIDGPQEVGS